MHAPPPEAPPPGGYGSGEPARGPGGVPRFGPGPPPPGGHGSGRGLVVALVTVAAVVLGIGTLSVLGMFVLRTYLASAKSNEVKNSLGQMAKDAAEAHERDRRVCPSASRQVPESAALIRGHFYQSRASEWDVDAPRDAGFACLRFTLTQPQYYQYRYEATPTSFLAGGRGDLDGDGLLSDFAIRGEVQDGRLMLSPSISEIDPEE